MKSETREPSVAPKGSPASARHRTLRREWTSRSAEDECALLEAALADARKRGDDDESRRLEARLRLLRA